ncbi:unnamed protein product [Arctia plantaginis]|uniref:glutathione transferase n=1 Tax=Arctia plantaginis TaxID=874455 RepID=A0A8S0ZCN1_ARCPL|nr:unnamed protein product [Arctia plantaginis]
MHHVVKLMIDTTGSIRVDPIFHLIIPSAAQPVTHQEGLLPIKHITMPKVVFRYFPAKGMGEGSRLLLAYGGQQFEDVRIAPENWPQYKSKTVFGQMPILEIDGKQYAQSVAISRYLGRKYGVAGDNEEEAFEIDQNVDFLNDIRLKAASIYNEPDATIKANKQADAEKNVYPDLLDKLNSIIVKNKGHIAAGKLTWGDFLFAGIYDFLKVLLQKPDLDKKYPAFKQVVDNVYSIPKVKAFADAAPPSQMGF